MEVRYRAKRGWPKKANWPPSISALTRTDRVFRFKIGISGSPRTRTDSYGGYDDMVVVYESTSRKHAKQVEDRLICLYKDHCDGRCVNKKRGGAGRNSKKPLHYVYIVRRFA